MFDYLTKTTNAHAVNYLSAKCGAGKTTAFISHIESNRYDHNFVYVAPTMQLIREVQQRLTEKNISYRTITSDSSLEPVGIRIMKAMQEASSVTGAVLLVCWKGYESMPYIPDAVDWLIAIDEVPQLDNEHDLTLPRNGHFIRDKLWIKRTIDGRIGVVAAKKPSALKDELEECLLDSAEEPFNKLYRDVLSDYKDVYINVDTWERLVEQNDYDTTDKSSNKILFLSLYNENLFKGALLLGANIEQSMLYDWLPRMHQVKFEKASFLEDGLRDVPARPDTKIYYLLGDRNVSRTLLDKRDDEGSTVEDRMDLAVKDLFNDTPYLYAPNKDKTSPILETHKMARKLSPSCHGLNDYQDYHAIYFSAALNRTPQQFRMLKDLGFDIDEVHNGTSRETAYQGISRTSLRDPNSKKPVTIVVHDRATAKMIGELIGTTNIEQLAEVVPSKAPAYTSGDIKKRQRAMKILSRYSSANCPPITSFKNNSGQNELFENEEPMDSNNQNREGNSHLIYVAVHSSLYDKEDHEFTQERMTLTKLISEFKTLSNAPKDKKEMSTLYNPSRYKRKPGSDGLRRGENFCYSSFLVLDFDSGEVSPEIFEELFWSNASRANKRSFLMYNTFHRASNNPNRFRALMFFSELAREIDHHKACYDYVEEQLTKAGFPPNKSGLDTGFKSPVMSFYAPGTNRLEPESHLFLKRGTSTEQIQRYGLVPHEIWAISQKPVETVSESQINFNGDVDQITAKLRSMTSGRHPEQFAVACKLARGGMKEQEIRRILGSCLGTSDKMKKKINDTIASLKNYKLL
jgi:hypothetical protein